jgi:hypothetical protein
LPVGAVRAIAGHERPPGTDAPTRAPHAIHAVGALLTGQSSRGWPACAVLACAT